MHEKSSWALRHTKCPHVEGTLNCRNGPHLCRSGNNKVQCITWSRGNESGWEKGLVARSAQDRFLASEIGSTRGRNLQFSPRIQNHATSCKEPCSKEDCTAAACWLLTAAYTNTTTLLLIAELAAGRRSVTVETCTVTVTPGTDYGLRNRGFSIGFVSRLAEYSSISRFVSGTGFES